MSTTCYLLIQHAPGARCAGLEPWPSQWPRAGRRGRSSFAEIEVGLRFGELLAAAVHCNTSGIYTDEFTCAD